MHDFIILFLFLTITFIWRLSFIWRFIRMKIRCLINIKLLMNAFRYMNLIIWLSRWLRFWYLVYFLLRSNDFTILVLISKILIMLYSILLFRRLSWLIKILIDLLLAFRFILLLVITVFVLNTLFSWVI